MKLDKRYFNVFYQGIKYGNPVIGSIDMTVNGGYLNLIETINIIKGDNNGMTDVCITNIIELNKADYIDWVRKY